MVTSILTIALLILVTALAVEVGIASWSIRRANRYRQKKSIAEENTDSMTKQVETLTRKFRALDKYAASISWLLKFLYHRYDKFSDIDKEIEEGVKDSTGQTPIVEMNEKYHDMKRAIKIAKITVRASDNIEGYMNTIATQIQSIIQELDVVNDDDDGEKNESPESPEPSIETESNPPHEIKECGNGQG